MDMRAFFAKKAPVRATHLCFLSTPTLIFLDAHLSNVCAPVSVCALKPVARNKPPKAEVVEEAPGPAVASPEEEKPKKSKTAADEPKAANETKPKAEGNKKAATPWKASSAAASWS